MVKRLERSRDKKLMGVCGGLGKYFGVDPTFIRVLFVAAFLIYGTGLLLYLVLGIVMPDEK